MLLKTSNITNPEKPQDHQGPVVSSFTEGARLFLADQDVILTKSLREINPGVNYHFYSWANFNLVRLIAHLLKFTGPAHLLMTSYSFSQKSVETMLAHKNTGLLMSVRILTDNRVKSMSPKPYQMLKESFDTRCISVHSKVALISNTDWHLSVITSQNATDNPKLERGIIFTDPEVFDFDFKILENEFNSGSVD